MDSIRTSPHPFACHLHSRPNLRHYYDETTPAFGIRVGKNRRTWVITNPCYRSPEAGGPEPIGPSFDPEAFSKYRRGRGARNRSRGREQAWPWLAPPAQDGLLPASQPG